MNLTASVRRHFSRPKPRFSAGTFWDLVETHRPTFFSAVPTIYAVLDAKTERRVDTSSLRFVRRWRRLAVH